MGILDFIRQIIDGTKRSYTPVKTPQTLSRNSIQPQKVPTMYEYTAQKYKTDVNAANLLLKKLRESVEIADSTNNPETFFKRLHYSFDCMLELMTYKNSVFKNNCTPEEQYKLQLDYMETRVNNFIDRSFKCESIKINNIKNEKSTRKALVEYFASMTVAFKNSHSYWEGSNMLPHYNGILYTDANLKKLMDLKNKYLTTSNDQTTENHAQLLDSQEKHLDTSHSNKVHFPHMRHDVFYQYNIDKMSFYYYGKCGDRDFADFYFIAPEYYGKVVNELTLINILLSNVHQEHPEIPLMKYNPSCLLLKKVSEYSNMFTMFRHHPLTYNLKEHKTPYSISIRFGEKDPSFFDVYYSKYGSVNNIRFVCWSKEFCYVMRARVYNKELQIISAYKKDGINEERIFDIDYELLQIRKNEYQWICDNLTEIAPKSLSAYTRAKNNRSEKYLKIEKEAYKMGKVLNDGILR